MDLGGRFDIERELGSGAMATVYLATDRKHDRRVALKVLRPELRWPGAAERFHREIQVAARLAHPNIVPLFDSGDANGLLYFVMQYVEGAETLRECLDRERALPVELAASLARDVASAIEYAHRVGVVHRDIKPENILLAEGRAMVLDFGIARALGSPRGERMTETGLVIGTPAYMSPEQAAGDDNVGPSTDIYSLGCVLFEMLGGAPPFSGTTPQRILLQQVQLPPRPIAALRPDTPPRLQQVVARCLEKDPAKRFSSAAELSKALVPGPAIVPARSRTWRAPALVLAAGVLCAIAALWLLRPRTTSSPSRILVLTPGVRGKGPDSSMATDLAVAMVAALASTGALTGLDAARVTGLAPDASARAVRAAAARLGAGYYLESTLIAGDSLRLQLSLHDLAKRATVERVVAVAGGSDPWQLAVRAIVAVLPVLIPSGAVRDLPALERHPPASLAAFFQGEAAYRRADFTQALAHYLRAATSDTTFGLAALRGSQAASWEYQDQEAGDLARVALRDSAELTAAQRDLARGLLAALSGDGDAAVAQFRSATSHDPNSSDAWLALGDAYTSLLPGYGPQDSLADEAFSKAFRLDPSFAPILYHLAESAARQGRVADARHSLDQLRRLAPDTSFTLGVADLVVRCAEGRIDSAAWRTAVLDDPERVVVAGTSMAVGGLRQPACAAGAWRAVLAHDTSRGGQAFENRFGAASGLFILDVVQGRFDQARARLEADPDMRAYRGQLLTVAALAGAPFRAEAEAYVADLRESIRKRPDVAEPWRWWLVGVWAAETGDTVLALAAADSIVVRAHAAAMPRDTGLAHSVRARVAVARGDTASALALFRTMRPSASATALTWTPWEGLGHERFQYARILGAQGDYGSAIQVAATMDSPASLWNLLYLPGSLADRAQWALLTGDKALADRSAQRLQALGRGNEKRAAY